MNEGTRIKWMGRCTVESFGPPMCAACGRVSVSAAGVAIVASEFPLGRLVRLRIGTKPVREVRRVGRARVSCSSTIRPTLAA